MGRGSSPSINLQAGARGTHARTHARTKEAGGQRCVPVLAVRGEGVPWSLYLPAPDPWFPALQASAHKGFLGVDQGQLGQLVRGRRQLLPGACCEK